MCPAGESLNPGDELSSLGEEAQPPCCGEEMGLSQGGGTGRCQKDCRGAQAQLGSWLCLYGFISLSLGPLVWKMETMTPTSRASLELVLKKNRHWPQCLALLPPGLQRGEGVGSSGEAHAFDPRGEEWPQTRGLGSAVSPAAHGSPAAGGPLLLVFSTRKMATTAAHPRTTS